MGAYFSSRTRPVKLVYYDDQSSPAQVPSIYAKMEVYAAGRPVMRRMPQHRRIVLLNRRRWNLRYARCCDKHRKSRQRGRVR